MGCASVQQQTSYVPLLQRAQLAPPLLHPAVVGAGPQPAEVDTQHAQDMVLLHWGDNKADKGLDEALSLLEAIFNSPVAQRPKCSLLFHCHAFPWLNEDQSILLDEAQRQLGHQLIVLGKQVSDYRMQQLFGQCSLALMAYDPIAAERSSGVFWCYAAARYGRGKRRKPWATGTIGCNESEVLGLSWRSMPHLCNGHKPSGEQWLDAINAMLNGSIEHKKQWQPVARQVLGQSFPKWVSKQLSQGSA